MIEALDSTRWARIGSVQDDTAFRQNQQRFALLLIAMARPRHSFYGLPAPTATKRRHGAGPCGAHAETWHINQVIASQAELDRFQILTIPGGFSYGDDLGAGRILATRMATTLGEALRRFHDRGGLVLGICNGFQVLVRRRSPSWRVVRSHHAGSQRIRPIRKPLGRVIAKATCPVRHLL